MAGKVYFVGAGPGDPDLLTVKARRIIETADVIVYADSLINPDICAFARKGAEIHKSSSLTLEKIHTLVAKAAKAGKNVARLQTGDPSIYGSLHEQAHLLEQQGIEYEVIPGVSSLFASAAALRAELTVPGHTQTVIVTRMEGNTPVPTQESLRSLAAHKSTMAIFLSTSLVDKVTTELLAGGYPPETPVAVVYRASWKDQKIVRARLCNLVESVSKSGITRQALILVGDFLEAAPEARSRLYNADFSHGYR
jgi:precorrin-4/cobalt-precorrin-4 C11-methyltransferase